MCRRPSCQGPASATLSFSYQTAEVLLLDLVEERHPSRWDLCRTHADTLGVPRGWSLTDGRESAAQTPAANSEPPASATSAPPTSARPTSASVTSPEPAAVAEGGRPFGGEARGASRRNRYAELSARLPELAGQHAGTARDAERSKAPDEDAGTDRPVHGRGSAGPHDAGAVGIPASDVPDIMADETIPGQLSMPLPDIAGEAEAVWGYAGNVVPLLRRESVLGSVT